MKSSKILLKNGQTVDLVDGRIADGDIASWNNKLNVDGSNATPVGVTTMMKQVETGSTDLNDDSTYFGDSNDDHTHIVRRPILNLWNYIKGKISSVLGLTASAYSGKAATAGTADKAVADKSGNDIETTYATKSELSTHTRDTTVHITAAERTAWNAKQSALTFDTTPTAGSTNPVTSGGIKTSIDSEASARESADTTLQSNINAVDAKGIVINEINGENVICFE